MCKKKEDYFSFFFCRIFLAHLMTVNVVANNTKMEVIQFLLVPGCNIFGLCHLYEQTLPLATYGLSRALGIFKSQVVLKPAKTNEPHASAGFVPRTKQMTSLELP